MPIDTQELMKQVARIRVYTKRLMTETLSGEYHSVFKGQGIEFDEVREYMAGDDVRSIDWNVTARMGHPYIKRFCEEREMTLFFLIDVSGSQGFGSGERTKTERAAEIAALLALSAVANQDKVGMALFSDRIEKYVPPRKGRSAVLRLVRDILATEDTRHGTDVSAALAFFNGVQKKRAVLFIVSDFLDDGFEPLLRLTAHKHDVICCPIADPRETELPNLGLLELEDPETGDRLLVDTASAAVRRAVAEHAAAHEAALRRVFRRLKIDCLFSRTDRPFIEGIRELFHLRQARRARQ